MGQSILVSLALFTKLPGQKTSGLVRLRGTLFARNQPTKFAAERYPGMYAPILMKVPVPEGEKVSGALFRAGLATYPNFNMALDVDERSFEEDFAILASQTLGDESEEVWGRLIAPMKFANLAVGAGMGSIELCTLADLEKIKGCELQARSEEMNVYGSMPDLYKEAYSKGVSMWK